MRTPDDAIAARLAIQDGRRSAGGCRTGFIGRNAENLLAQGLAVTVIDAADQILPHIFDQEMANYAIEASASGELVAF